MEFRVEENESNTASRKAMRVGIAADHAGYESRQVHVIKLADAGYEVIDFGDDRQKIEEDYTEFVIAMAQAVGSGKGEHGVAIYGSGVGVSVAANKVHGFRERLAEISELEKRELTKAL